MTSKQKEQIPIKKDESSKEAPQGILFRIFENLNKITESYNNQANNSSSRTLIFRLARVFFAIIIVGIGVNILIQKSTKVDSLQGFINSETLPISALTEGNVQFEGNISVGQFLKAGQNIGWLESTDQEYLNDLEIRLNEAEAKLRASRKHYQNLLSLATERQRLLSEYTQKSFRQKTLRLSYERAKLKQYQDELKGAENTAKLAKIEMNRLKALEKEGYIAQSDVDKAELEMNEAETLAKTRTDLIKQSQSAIIAASNGLQVDGSQTVSYQEAQRKDLEKEIFALKQQATEAELQIDLNESEIAKLNQQLNNQRKIPLKAPIDGIIWSVIVGSGGHVEANQPIIKLINCKTRWVEAFVDEKDYSQLYVGAPVGRHSLNADRKGWSGTIRAIRGGDSRAKVGQDIDIAPPELVRRQVSLKVEVDWKNQNENYAISSREFCRVGSSVKIKFKKQSPLKLSKI